MRTLLLSILGVIVLVGAFGCSTTVKTDSGHAVSTGVHAH